MMRSFLKKIRGSWMRVVLQTSLVLLGLTGCSAVSAKSAEFRVLGGVDVLPLISTTQSEFSRASGIALKLDWSPTSLDDLRSGKADAVLVGRELSPAEKQGFRQTAIAYDAVCLIINTRVFKGGLLQTTSADLGGMVIPQAKFSGVQNFSLEDLKNYTGNLLQKSQDRWYVPGAFFTFEPYFNGNIPEVDPQDPKKVVGTWVWNPIDLSGENLQAGKFDTQAVVMQKVGYPLSDLNNPRLSFAARVFTSEEELISARFEAGLIKELKQDTSAYQFKFSALFASRRVTLRAQQHDFYVSALAMDGVDPLGDPQSIYSGKYLLSRKIYLVTREPSEKDAQALLDFYLSEQGQNLIAKALYLPLPKN